MAKISQYPDGGTIQDTDQFVSARAGSNFSNLWSTIKATVGLTYSAVTMTTGDLSAVEGTYYDLTIAGLTANRNIDLPTPSATGKKVGIRVLDGDATYCVIIRANSVELTRLFIAGEYLEFISTGTGAANWKCSRDGRVPSSAYQRAGGAQAAIATATPTKLNLGTSVLDNSSLNDTGNNRIVIRRAGNYEVRVKVPWDTNAAADPAAHAAIYKGGASLSTLFLPNSANEYITPMNLEKAALAVGDAIEVYGTQNSGVNRNTYYSAAQGAWVSLIVTEVFDTRSF